MTGILLLAYLALPPKPVILPLSCDSVRQIVQMLGVEGAEAMALQRGWTAQQIAEARRVCLAPPAKPSK
jgi:hypothetical protein